ncbi:MAG: protein kinase [Thermoguttaceae bacterium]|nr:protein kinase [Thermoguttaceae bacterium]
MSDLALEALVQKAVGLGVLELDVLQGIWHALGTQNVSVDEFLQMALRQNALTKYQAERLKFGESTGFFFGPYKVLYLVGAGTFSRVYRAVHSKTGQVVAVKVLRARFSQDQAAIDQFTEEAQFSIGLKHPNIVTMYDVASDKDGHYMVMDFIEGQTLRDMVKIQKVVNPKMAVHIMCDVCSGLDFALHRGHTHRDMKLSNVLISSSGKAVLIDFGLAATEKDEDPSVKNQRTVDYAALERITGVGRNDKRSDIYFVGVMFYYMLAGVSPILETKDRARRMERARFVNVTPLREKNPAIPPLLTFIVDKAMSLDPEKRYQTPGAMLLDLQVAEQKLADGTGFEVSDPTTSLLKAVSLDTTKKTILVVEADTELQDVFREALKKQGYRVLVISDCARAMERFEYPDHGIDCAVFNAQYLGPAAVMGFNKLAQSTATRNIPAILLLDEDQVRWGAKALRSKHRLAVGMPITMRRLVEVIRRLLEMKIDE